MQDKIKFIVTCAFKAWGENNMYPPFGVKYLIEIPLNLADDIENVFKNKYKEVIKQDFDGDILFIEETDLVKLT